MSNSHTVVSFMSNQYHYMQVGSFPSLCSFIHHCDCFKFICICVYMWPKGEKNFTVEPSLLQKIFVKNLFYVRT